MRAFVSAAAAAASLSLAGPAAAAIIIDVGAGDIQPDENLLFINAPRPGLTIEGITNQSDTLVSITGGEILRADGGQASARSLDGRLNTTFTYQGFANQLIAFDLSDAGLGFTSTEFRIFGTSATQATLTFVDTDGEVFQSTFALPANGFFNATAIDGQLIDYFSIAVNAPVRDFRQIRIGGVQAIPTAAVPEPATWAMMIVGFGGVGALLRRRRLAGPAFA